MPCEGFGGVMSCRCAEECWATVERHTARRYFIATNDKVCFTRSNGDALESSDMLNNLSDVRFFARARLPLPPGWEVDPRDSTYDGGWVSSLKLRWARLAGISIKSLRPVTQLPRPNSLCPLMCSHAGTCVELLGKGTRCRCHRGFRGLACEDSDPSECVNGCSSHGMCLSRYCRCDSGWFGLDCSLRRGTRMPLTYAPTYVYPLPTELSMDFVYQRDPRWRGLFYSNRVYLEALHANRDSLVADPEQAALFFIPVMLTQMRDSLWEARRFLPEIVHWIRANFPFWNRTGGADHYVFTGQDMVRARSEPSPTQLLIV